MSSRGLSNVIGFDDAPFPRSHQGQVKIIGAVFANLRFDGVIIGEIEKDGSDAAKKITHLIANSKFVDHIKLIMLQGITMGGFNVVDVFYLHRRLGLPVLVVSRNEPDMKAFHKALTSTIPHGREKWLIIEKLGKMEPAGKVHIQRVGLTFEQAIRAIKHFSVHSNIPEPIRTAHLIAGAVADGESRGCP